MKTTNRFATALLLAGLFAVPASMFAQGPGYAPGQGYNQGPGYGNQGPGYGNQGPGYGRPQGGWDSPPDRFTRDIQRNAFRDGLNGARKDLENRRRPNVMNRDEYRNYRGPDRRLYRDAFQAGYRSFWDHQGRGARPY